MELIGGAGLRAYLNVLIVASPFSMGSGVFLRSSDISLGAIFVARPYRSDGLVLRDERSCYELWLVTIS